MITAVFACMNRENNLVQSIESWIKTPEITEFIVVDWSSNVPLITNEKIKYWLNNLNFKLYRVAEEKFFSLSKAYNLGISKSNNNIILKLDADYVSIDNSWIKKLNIIDNNELDNFFITGKDFTTFNGFVLINKKDFVLYNENFRGYGWDDIDLYNRTVLHNKTIKRIIFLNITKHIYHIPHSDKDRIVNYEIKNKIKSMKINQILANKKFTTSKYSIINGEDKYIELKRISTT